MESICYFWKELSRNDILPVLGALHTGLKYSYG